MSPFLFMSESEKNRFGAKSSERGDRRARIKAVVEKLTEIGKKWVGEKPKASKTPFGDFKDE